MLLPMTFPLTPRPGFNPLLIRWGGPDEFVDENCSYCDQPIGEEEVPLRMWNEQHWTAQFCEHCMEVWFGMHSALEDGDDG
jgi:hypothetical protein